MERGILLFYTATALYWQNLFESPPYKKIVIESLRFLYVNNLLNVYAFVIMPNHIHLLIEVTKETPANKDIQHSFMSYTSHEFRKYMMQNDNEKLTGYYVNDIDRVYQFWERNPKIVEVGDSNVAGQIVNYIHLNPLQEKWSLVKEPEDYEYSSALFYSDRPDQFQFLKHFMDYFDR